ncbi:hypothetical protein GOBAR_DD27799 [Gossypium barbadense]|nr:hypothetical protein GOBAR_DD27799 [Gossypium barbadense]
MGAMTPVRVTKYGGHLKSAFGRCVLRRQRSYCTWEEISREKALKGRRMTEKGGQKSEEGWWFIARRDEALYNHHLITTSGYGSSRRGLVGSTSWLVATSLSSRHDEGPYVKMTRCCSSKHILCLFAR